MTTPLGKEAGFHCAVGTPIHTNVVALYSSDDHLVGEGAAADPQRDYRADGVTEVDGEAALAHLSVSDVHLALPEVLLHYKIALCSSNRRQKAQVWRPP